MIYCVNCGVQIKWDRDFSVWAHARKSECSNPKPDHIRWYG